MKKKIMMIALTGGLLLSVTACNGVGAAKSGTAAKTVVTTTSSTTSGASVTTDSSTTGNSNTDSTTTASSGTSSSTATGTVKADMFTDRDKDASYDESSATKVNLSEIKDSTYTITKEGVYILSGTYSGQIIVNVADTAKVQLVLDGVTITNESSAAIYVKEADKVFVTLKDGTTSTLTTSGTFVATDDNNVDGVIFSKGDLAINGSGSLKISSTAHGIVGKDDVVITGGNIDITSTKKGISGKDSVRIADGTINITTGTDGIHSENSDDTSKGFVYIEGGNITINAADDGIHAGTNLDIVGGKINITQSNEGLEGKDVNISGGEVNVVSSDDGINATASATTGQKESMQAEDASINISGGKITVNAEGDGVDSNGDLTVSGGETYVSGPTRGGNGGIDYNGTGTITGGTFIVTEIQSMTENFGSSSTQGVVQLSVSNQAAGTTVSIADSKGNVLASYTPAKEYNSVIISTKGMAQGETYTVTAGTTTQQVTLSQLVSGSGGMGGMQGGPGGPGGNDGPGGNEGGPRGGFGNGMNGGPGGGNGGLGGNNFGGPQGNGGPGEN
ncbi:MAG: carbohydrate-binding domain-containing protein, partial [Lachnospiraceae bacterium]|nr:carbohydrate-binding domain-containing protein [Lachnospiraceae bacterium]